MNHLIMKYSRPLTAAMLAIFAWVIYQRASRGWGEVATLAVAALVVWLLGTPLLIVLWPRITVGGFRRAILRRGLGDGPIPVNTLYATRGTSSASVAPGSVLATGTQDLLYLAGWLDLGPQPLVLHVPDLTGRYYSLQFTAPSDGANVAYVGTRATGTGAGDYLLTAPGWTGAVPGGTTHLPAPSRSLLVIGRVFVRDDADLDDAYALAKQIQVEPLR